MDVVLATMSALSISTLTLPGVADIVLTIAIAVDAQRADLRAYPGRRCGEGARRICRDDTGFTRAFVTIVDARSPPWPARLVMFWLGSGPRAGFAVTLHARS